MCVLVIYVQSKEKVYASVGDEYVPVPPVTPRDKRYPGELAVAVEIFRHHCRLPCVVTEDLKYGKCDGGTKFVI